MGTQKWHQNKIRIANSFSRNTVFSGGQNLSKPMKLRRCFWYWVRVIFLNHQLILILYCMCSKSIPPICLFSEHSSYIIYDKDSLVENPIHQLCVLPVSCTSCFLFGAACVMCLVSRPSPTFFCLFSRPIWFLTKFTLHLVNIQASMQPGRFS